MRTRMTKKEEKMMILLDAFQKAEELSIKEITELLACSRKSAYNYINGLRQNGCVFHTRIYQNQTLYSLEKAESHASPLLSYHPLTADTLRKYMIIQTLQKGPISQKNFHKQFMLTSENIECDRNGYPLDIGQTRFYSLVRQLRDSGDIVFNQEEGRYYLTDAHIPFILSLDADSLFDMHDKLSCISPGHPCYKQLHSIYQKEELLLGNPNEDMPYYDHYLIYGRSHQYSDRIRQQLDLLEQYDYRHKLLEISYQSQKGTCTSTLFATGIIVCSLEKDSLYLLGKMVASKQNCTNSRCIIIKMDRIQSITCTEETHSCYHDEYFQSVFDTMFSVSTEPPVPVKVEFDASLKQKFYRLHSQRKASSITKNSQNNTFIYTDSISGLFDFANYLRQFGQYVKVLEPVKLKKIMARTVTRSLDRYNEEIHNA